MAQPPLNSNRGVILTVGLVTNNDRWEMVIPLATDGAAHSGITMCADAGIGYQTNVLPIMLQMLSLDTEVRFIQVEGMVDGSIPARRDFAPGAQVGFRDHGPLPTNVAALAVFYGDPLHTLPSGRTRVGKNFIAGIASDDVVGDHVQNALGTTIQNWAVTLLDGFLGGDGVTMYYRVVRASDRIAGQPLCNCVAVVVREYVATQRRRLTPH